MSQGERQEAAHAAWRGYRDKAVAEGRKDRRSLRAREFFAGFEEGRAYQRRVHEANAALTEFVAWIEERPDQFEDWKTLNPETYEALKRVLIDKKEKPHDRRIRPASGAEPGPEGSGPA